MGRQVSNVRPKCYEKFDEIWLHRPASRNSHCPKSYGDHSHLRAAVGVRTSGSQADLVRVPGRWHLVPGGNPSGHGTGVEGLLWEPGLAADFGWIDPTWRLPHRSARFLFSVPELWFPCLRSDHRMQQQNWSYILESFQPTWTQTPRAVLRILIVNDSHGGLQF